MASSASIRRLASRAYHSSVNLDMISKSLNAPGPSLLAISNRLLPYSSEDIIPAPVRQISYIQPGASLSSRLVPLTDFAQHVPIFQKIVCNPLMKKGEVAWEVGPSWRSIIGSFIGIGHSNLNQGVMAGPSFVMENILVDPLFFQAHLAEPMGIKFDGNIEINNSLTYGSISGLIDDIKDCVQPEVSTPRDLVGLQEKMRASYISKIVEELIVHNPCLLEKYGYVGLFHHLYHLLRRCYYNSNDLGVATARQIALGKLGIMTGQDGVMPWQDVVRGDGVLNDRLAYVCNNIPSLTTNAPLPSQEVWRGSIVLAVGRSEFVHCWESKVLKKLKLDPVGLTMHNVVQHSRHRLPLLPSLAAEGLLDAGKGGDLGLRNFFSPHPLIYSGK